MSCRLTTMWSNARLTLIELLFNTSVDILLLSQVGAARYHRNSCLSAQSSFGTRPMDRQRPTSIRTNVFRLLIQLIQDARRVASVPGAHVSIAFRLLIRLIRRVAAQLRRGHAGGAGVSIAFRLLIRLIRPRRRSRSPRPRASLNCLSAFDSVDTRPATTRTRPPFGARLNCLSAFDSVDTSLPSSFSFLGWMSLNCLSAFDSVDTRTP